MSDIRFEIDRALRQNNRYEGHNFIDQREARELTYRAGSSSYANGQLRDLRGQISRGYVRADGFAVQILDRHLYDHTYRPAPMAPMPLPPIAPRHPMPPPMPRPECDRSVGGVARDAVIGGLLGGVLGGILAGEDGARAGAAIGGVTGAVAGCD